MVLVAGHMGEYKTLYWLRMRFIWPGLREDIKTLVAACAHFASYNTWCTRSSKLYYLWPITVPFWMYPCGLMIASTYRELRW